MCYMLAAGKKATADGSIMVARNCDAYNESQVVVSVPRRKHAPGTMIKNSENRRVDIPQVEETYAYTAVLHTASEDTYPVNMGGINEFQLSAGASTGGAVKPEVEKLTPWPDTALGDTLMTLVLERCRTAREAIRFMGDMTEKYGARGDNYIVSDPHELWLFEQYYGYHWAAARVPDDCFVVEANSFRLAEINPDDPENYMCDPDLIPFAVKHGLWDPNSGEPFHASRAYSTNEITIPGWARKGYPQKYINQHRIWRGNMLLKPSAALDPFEPSGEYPLFMRPDKKITMADIFNVLKDDYRGTVLDEYGAQDEQFPTIIDPVSGHYRLSPAWSKNRLIGCPNTVTSWITQTRSWLPDAIGGVLWAGLAATVSSPHVPFYACNRRTPIEYQTCKPSEISVYQDGSAYWLFKNIGNLRNLFFQGTEDLVRPAWEAFEDNLYAHQAAVEAGAMLLYQQDKHDEAAEFLTDYSYGTALRALETGKTMLNSLWTRVSLINTPMSRRGYTDPRTWDDIGSLYMIH